VLPGVFDAGAVDAHAVAGGVLADERERVAGVEVAWQGGFYALPLGFEVGELRFELADELGGRLLVDAGLLGEVGLLPGEVGLLGLQGAVEAEVAGGDDEDG